MRVRQMVLLSVCLAFVSSPVPGASAPKTGHKGGQGPSGPVATAKRTLHLGWSISPAGRSLATGDMLLGGAFSPDGRLYAIGNGGFQANAVHIVDVASEREVARVRLGCAWNGIAWAPDGNRIYVAGGPKNLSSDVYVIHRDDGKWSAGDGIKLSGVKRSAACVSGLAIDGAGKVLYVANLGNGKLYTVDAVSGDELASVEVGSRPVVCRLASDGKTLAVACWGDGAVALVDVADPRHPSVRSRISVGAHPNDVVLGADGRAFASCGEDDSVAVMDVAGSRVEERVRVRLTPNAPRGATPNAVALAPDGKTLYVANADNNCICVVDVSQRGSSKVDGFIPTGWYPTAVACTPDGRRLIACSGKGMGTRPNPSPKPIDQTVPKGFEYIGRQLSGLISFVDMPDGRKLSSYTRQVISNSPYRDAMLSGVRYPGKTVIPRVVGGPCPIRYVLYIIKENRTYDQVLGDMARGNGDAGLCLFGRDVTPNQHALAEQYVLLDNLYCAGEVSETGHPWSTSAIVTDFTERSWTLSYSGKGHPQGGDEVKDPSTGYIWQACQKKGIPVRTYGEYANHPSLAGMSSEAYIGKPGFGSAPPGRDTERAAIFIKELHEFEKAGTVPRFMIMSLGENHTRGTQAGAFTPKAMVASNDLAVGQIVEAVSHSSIWKECAIFVIEDDAQNGPDHVDSHRTCGLVISPYVRRGIVDSTFYTTNSMLRTMELILGLAPLTEYDAAATPMFRCFGDKPDLQSYAVLPARIDLQARNAQTAYGAADCDKMDWSEYDRIDADKLNRILWHSMKGANTPYPTPVRSAIYGSVAAQSND